MIFGIISDGCWGGLVCVVESGVYRGTGPPRNHRGTITYASSSTLTKPDKAKQNLW